MNVARLSGRLSRDRRYWLVALDLIAWPFGAFCQQPLIPGVTDIVTVVDASPLDSARFVAFAQRCCQDSSYFLFSRDDLVGWVTYRSDLRAYVVTYALPGTIDSQWTGLVCNVPDLKKWNRQRVRFSGRYYRAPDRLIRYGGEEVFFLYVTTLQTHP